MTEAKHKPPAVHAGAKKLVEILLAKPGITLADAAQEAGLTTRSAKVYLGRPNVVAYYRGEKRRLVEELALANPQALANIRDTALNTMSRVQAARALESMCVDAVQESGGQRQRPGLQIVIVQSSGEHVVVSGPQPVPMIEAAPIEQTTD
jgi:hypothetical protein